MCRMSNLAENDFCWNTYKLMKALEGQQKLLPVTKIYYNDK